MNNKFRGSFSTLTKTIFTVFIGIGISTSNAGQIDDVRNTLKEWVSVEKTISQEQEKWRQEKQLLNDTLTSLNQEERILRDTIDNAQQDTSKVDQERLDLISNRDEYQKGSSLIQDKLALYEQQAIRLIPQLPLLLRDEIAPLIRKVYVSDNENLPLSERTQNLISLLSAIQKFDSSISVANEIRTLKNGEEAEVKVLFLGLSRGFYVDATKKTAAIGHPVEGGSDQGWQWTEQNGLADDILQAVEIYENSRNPSLINLPLEIQQN